MYRYDSVDQAIVDQRVAEFRDQTERYLRGELSEDAFRPLRLLNGLYYQRYAPMLRIAVPYGVVSAGQVRTLAHVARIYDRGVGHVTTRQNLQLNHPRVEDVPDILAELARVEMHAIQTSGNCVRNVTTDPMAGVAPDEIADPRPYCELIRQWATLHPEFLHLPRKFKIAVSGAVHDRATVRVHDVGLRIVENEVGERGFEVWAGGGLGRLPILSQRVRAFLPEAELLTYLEALLRVYNREGRRDNKHKARIKVLVKARGIEDFREAVEREYRQGRDTRLRLDPARIEAVHQAFAPPAYADEAVDDDSIPLEAPKAFSEGQRRRWRYWLERNVSAHRVRGYRAVYIALKGVERPPGDVTADELERVADWAERYSFGEVRTTYQQNLVLPDVRRRDLPALFEELESAGLAEPTIGLLTDPICCPGFDYCSLANAHSIPVARALQERFADLDHVYDLGDLRLNISGCMNACGHHHTAQIGLLGVEKQGRSWYQIQIGGADGDAPALGKVLGPAVPAEDVVPAVERVVEHYLAQRREGESFRSTFQRIGLGSFRDALAEHA